MRGTPSAAGGPHVEAQAQRYRLRLFVAGDEPNSVQARSVLSRVCESRVRGRYELEIVDAFVNYQVARDSRVLMVRTLIVEEAPPPRLIVGSFRDVGVLADALGLPAEQGRS